MISHWQRSCWAILSLWLVLGAIPLPAQEVSPTFRYGSHALRRILFDSKFTALDGWDKLEEDAPRTLLICLGSRIELANIPQGLRKYLEQGGGLLLATDQRLLSTELTDLVGYQVSGFPVKLPDGSESQLYRGLPEYPFVKPAGAAGAKLFTSSQALLPGAPLQLATNRPSFLESLKPNPLAEVEPVAEFPREAIFLDLNRGQWYRRLRGSLVYGVRGQYGSAGQILFLADHSVFINDLMLQEDNGNVDFAYNVVDWFQGQRRDRLLFIEDGLVQTKLDIPIREIKLPLRELQRELIAQGNELMMEIQEKNRQDNRLNGVVVDTINQTSGRALFGRNRSQNFLTVLMWLSALGLVFYGMMRLRRASYRPEPYVPKFASAAARHAPPRSLLEHRQRAALQEDNLSEFAHLLAREWWQSVRPESLTQPPTVLATGNWWHRWAQRRKVYRIWDLANAQPSSRLTRRDFGNLLLMMQQLRDALSSGALRFE